MEDFAESIPKKYWDVEYLSEYATLEFVQRHLGTTKWNWENLSRNENLTVDFVNQNKDKPWIWDTLAWNSSIDSFGFVTHMDQHLNWKELSSNKTITPELVLRFKTKPWDWEYLSENVGIPLTFIEQHPEFPWEWDDVSQRNDISPEYIERNITRPWNWEWLSVHISPEFVDRFEDQPWSWHHLSHNLNMTQTFAQKHAEKLNLNWDRLLESGAFGTHKIDDFMYYCYNKVEYERLRECESRHIAWVCSSFLYDTLQTNCVMIQQRPKRPKRSLEAFAETVPRGKWDTETLCAYASLEFIQKHNIEIDWESLSLNSSVTPEFMDRHADQPWDWNFMSYIGQPKIGVIERFIDKPWNWHYLSRCVTPAFVEQYPDKPWKWGEKHCCSPRSLSNNENITLEFIDRHLDEDWNWGHNGLSVNPVVTLEFIERHIDKPWCWHEYGLSVNPNVTLEFVRRNLDKRWDWYELNETLTLKFDEIDPVRKRFASWTHANFVSFKHFKRER